MRVLIFSFTLLFLNVSMACSCLTTTLEEKVRSSDFIYFGKITSSSLIGGGKVLNRLELIQSLKNKPDNLELLSYSLEGMCDMPSAVGVTYIVYGKYNKQSTLSACSFTQPHVKSMVPDFEEQLTSIKSIANKRLWRQ